MPRKKRNPPSREILRDFLRDRRRRTVAEVAAMLGTSPALVEERARDEEATLRRGTIAWRDAARWLVDDWSPVTLFALLAGDAELLPVGFEPVPVVVTAPAYVVHGLRAQWQSTEESPPTFEEYLTEVLLHALDPVAAAPALSSDPEFMRAFHYPEYEEDA